MAKIHTIFFKATIFLNEKIHTIFGRLRLASNSKVRSRAINYGGRPRLFFWARFNRFFLFKKQTFSQPIKPGPDHFH